MRLYHVARGLTMLAGIGYLAFDAYAFVAGIGLPVFIVVENIVYGIIFLVGAAFYRDPRVSLFVTLVAAFSAGRVSRSIITATGQVAPLALQHSPLLLGLLAVAVLSGLYTYASCKARPEGCGS